MTILITEIKTAKKSLKALYLDGKFEIYIDAHIFENSRYKVGDYISEDELKSLVYASETRRARERAFYYLEYKDYSKNGIFDKLKKNVSQDVARETVNYLEDLGLLDDRKYAKKCALELLEKKGYARPRVEYELKAKGIDREIVEEVIDEISIEPKEQIKYLIDRKFPGLLRSEKSKTRAINTMRRYGHTWEDIKSVLRDMEMDY